MLCLIGTSDFSNDAAYVHSQCSKGSVDIHILFLQDEKLIVDSACTFFSNKPELRPETSQQPVTISSNITGSATSRSIAPLQSMGLIFLIQDKEHGSVYIIHTICLAFSSLILCFYTFQNLLCLELLLDKRSIPLIQILTQGEDSLSCSMVKIYGIKAQVILLFYQGCLCRYQRHQYSHMEAGLQKTLIWGNLITKLQESLKNMMHYDPISSGLIRIHFTTVQRVLFPLT